MNRATQAEGLGGAIERMIADRVAEAVAEEREACAKLAETFLNGDEIYGPDPFLGILLGREDRTRAKLAAAIRARKKPS